MACQVDSLLEDVVGKIDALADRFALCFPSGCSRNQRYDAVDNFEWTPGFWVGMLWLAYEHTQDARYRALAEAHLPSFEERLDRGDVHTHDLGFLFTLSCVAAHKLTGNEDAKTVALRAAELLALRYSEEGRIIQAWGRLDDPEHRGRIIIDSVMNMPLLFWAGETTGRDNYRRIARNHLDQIVRHIVRPDGSTAHTCYIDPRSGERLYTRTHQGHSDDSCWSRGQAWGIYGFSLGYQYTGERRFRDVGKRLANYFLARLPADGICYWDMIFDEGADAEKDSSAAAIAAAGMLALSQQLPSDEVDRERYDRAARKITTALATDYVSTSAGEDGILLHGVWDRPGGRGVEECCIWGDYFYTEALTRLQKDWTPYW